MVFAFYLHNARAAVDGCPGGGNEDAGEKYVLNGLFSFPALAAQATVVASPDSR